MSDHNVLILKDTLSPVESFENISAARKALKSGQFGEGTFNIVTLHEKATLQTQTVQKVSVESETFRSRAPRKAKAAADGE